ncbi:MULTISPECIES: hypothetical protein [unclassified Microcoleus]|uniref:hypothetical protein n=1 Tax=unclassified Microcoleus TaxID=2642155 RepID=UPI0025CFC72F|nr:MULTISPECIES: hypothetical protein [unclassified Microcoleus]
MTDSLYHHLCQEGLKPNNVPHILIAIFKSIATKQFLGLLAQILSRVCVAVRFSIFFGYYLYFDAPYK